jgi:hypothetical protein
MYKLLSVKLEIQTKFSAEGEKTRFLVTLWYIPFKRNVHSASSVCIKVIKLTIPIYLSPLKTVFTAIKVI